MTVLAVGIMMACIVFLSSNRAGNSADDSAISAAVGGTIAALSVMMYWMWNQ